MGNLTCPCESRPRKEANGALGSLIGALVQELWWIIGETNRDFIAFYSVVPIFSPVTHPQEGVTVCVECLGRNQPGSQIKLGKADTLVFLIFDENFECPFLALLLVPDTCPFSFEPRTAGSPAHYEQDCLQSWGDLRQESTMSMVSKL